MRLGFHISIAGGLSRVVPRALKIGCETIQFFSRNPRAWRDRVSNPGEIMGFKKALAKASLFPLFLHTPYLINVASPSPELHSRSIKYLVEELQYAEHIGAQFVIVHAGNMLTLEEKEAFARVAQAVNTSFREAKNTVQLLLENTAGQGSEIGYIWYQLESIVRRIEDQKRIGICIDTAHAFAAGYNLATIPGLEHMLNEFDKHLGLNKLKVFHLNDSRAPFNSKKDRHWHIGEGEIGLSGFSQIVNHPALAHLPGIIETPRKSDADDLRNMKIMRSLIK